jgi:hypothetical protein
LKRDFEARTSLIVEPFWSNFPVGAKSSHNFGRTMSPMDCPGASLCLGASPPTPCSNLGPNSTHAADYPGSPHVYAGQGKFCKKTWWTKFDKTMPALLNGAVQQITDPALGVVPPHADGFKMGFKHS